MYATLETQADQLTVTLSGEHRDGSHTVLHDVAGPAGGTIPAAANVLYFDGPATDAAFAAADFAYRERIAPAFRVAPGAVRSLVLFDPVRRATVVVSTAVDAPALEALGQAIGGQELLPGEDVALLPGPDRVGFHPVARVVESS
jgi:hypothetical protein